MDKWLLTVALMNINSYNGTMSSHEGNKTTIDTEKIEELRRILEREQSRQITYEEAFEVAKLLLSFFDNLADNSLGVGQTLLMEASLT